VFFKGKTPASPTLNGSNEIYLWCACTFTFTFTLPYGIGRLHAAGMILTLWRAVGPPLCVCVCVCVS
jgi:hypothetical protein